MTRGRRLYRNQRRFEAALAFVNSSLHPCKEIHEFLAEGQRRPDLSGTACPRELPLDWGSLPLPWRGAGSRLHGSRNDSSQLKCLRSRPCASRQPSEHVAINFASRRPGRVQRLWQRRHSRRRLSGVNARSSAAGPSARATSIADLCVLAHQYHPRYLLPQRHLLHLQGDESWTLGRECESGGGGIT